jgi:hypothetical protein
VIFKVILTEESKCVDCGKILPEGYNGYLDANTHYDEAITSRQETYCEGCMNKKYPFFELKQSGE